MHRFYIDSELKTGDCVVLPQEEAKHAINVLRLNENDDVEILNGSHVFIAQISSLEKQKVTVLLGEAKHSVESKTKIYLFQGMPKADKISSIVQKSTEIGVFSIIPMDMERSVRKLNDSKKLEDKLKKVAIEAAKQCGRDHIPEITKVLSLKDSLSLMKNMDLLLVPWEYEVEHSLYNCISNLQEIPESIGIVIGPEGGISHEELKLLKNIGSISISLGKRILRTETAGICTAFGVLALLNDL